MISGNTAGESAGGFLLYDAYETDPSEDYDGRFTMRDTTISGNTAGEHGGGVLLYEIENTVLIENSTISGNTADADTLDAIAGNGGGLALYYVAVGGLDTGSVTIDSSTIANNTTGTGFGDGIYLYDNGTLPDETMTLRNTIVADNGEDLATEAGSPATIQLDYSLIENPGTATTECGHRGLEHHRHGSPAGPARRQRRADPDASPGRGKPGCRQGQHAADHRPARARSPIRQLRHRQCRGRRRLRYRSR